ncbi:hypothetical protein CHGG_08964 [Chaetomium globosum CBS 148.51]|uniref:Uncharacterized protein n=1 Tax=Chaetomium globosum (strain ATCC 6205 / CBS 148.51 / DSM 1962 / NBRC 6347 / NRRL 1970) TaxID=306901 RepID=Q2GSU0_CHAGB|nr:uncharacterized protein CHGG_08964 [Chaetomium globosum CBS 148.51]EAQ84950.1 hypothetical protein CHGG_08964 [Chaetomium globosum CBS 148.51]
MFQCYLCQMLRWNEASVLQDPCNPAVTPLGRSRI